MKAKESILNPRRLTLISPAAKEIIIIIIISMVHHLVKAWSAYKDKKNTFISSHFYHTYTLQIHELLVKGW